MKAVLLAVWLAAPCLAAGAAAPQPSFPAAFAGAVRQGLGQDPFYGSRLAGAVEAQVSAVAGLPGPDEVRAGLEAAAGAADAGGMERLKASLRAGDLPPERAAALLTAAALAQPALFDQTLDSLETLRPGLGASLASVFAKADGPGGPAVVAALRRAGRREPRSANAVYGRDGRWERLFDGNVFSATLRETAPTAVRAPAASYGPDARPRGGLLPAGREGVLLKRADGGFESLSPAEFERRFGVRYLPAMPKEAPQALRRAHANYRGAYESGFGPRPAFLAGEDYAARLRAGRHAELYVARAGEKVGFGAFAARAIKAGDLIGEYTGAWRDGVPYEEALQNGYLFEYPTAGNYLVDASREGNATRFVNHSEKNANARVAFVFEGGYYHILFVATRDISVDEQVLIDYGRKYWQGRGAPQPL